MSPRVSICLLETHGVSLSLMVSPLVSLCLLQSHYVSLSLIVVFYMGSLGFIQNTKREICTERT